MRRLDFRLTRGVGEVSYTAYCNFVSKIDEFRLGSEENNPKRVEGDVSLAAR